jgi:hypothetical protein
MDSALHLGRSAALGRGLIPTPGVRLAGSKAWTQASAVPDAHTALLTKLNEPGVVPIVVERVNGRYVISRTGDRTAVEASDSAAALDAVVAVTRGHGDRTMHLHFKGVDDDGARAFAQVTEMHAADTKPIRVRTSVDTGNAGTIEVLGDIRNGRWDLRRAEVRVVDPPPVNAMRESLALEIMVPAEKGIGGLRMRIEVLFERTMQVTAELMSRITQSVQAALDALAAAGENVDMLLASRRIIATVRVDDEAILNVRIRIRNEAGEVNVVRNVLAPSDGSAE